MKTPKKSVKVRKEIKLNRIERAILNLASLVELLPGCEYRVKEETLAILGLELLPPTSKQKRV